jgi:hypothetical protein
MSDLSSRDPTADELASAYVDGVATADERAAVEADGRLGARVEELRAVRRRWPPVAARSAAAVDAIAAAMAGATDEQAPWWRPDCWSRPARGCGAGCAPPCSAWRCRRRRRDRGGIAAVGRCRQPRQRRSVDTGTEQAATAARGTSPPPRPPGRRRHPGRGGGAATTAVAAVASTATSSWRPGTAPPSRLGPINAPADLRTALRPLVSSGLSTADRSAPASPAS